MNLTEQSKPTSRQWNGCFVCLYAMHQQKCTIKNKNWKTI